MSIFKSYTDKYGNKVKIGDWVEIGFNLDEKVDRTGKVTEIKNGYVEGISLTVEGSGNEHFLAKNTRKMSL